MFTKRRDGSAIIFSGNHSPGRLVKNTVQNGDCVVLQIGSESVLVENVQVLGYSRFRGEVNGFEPSGALEYQGLKVGEDVTFEEAHIISCSS
jgi:hypothetical protein